MLATTFIVPVKAGVIDSRLFTRLDSRYDTRINLFVIDPTTTFNSGDSTYIVHGWGTSEALSGRDLAEFLSTARATLSIDGARVPLRRYQWQEDDNVYVLFWVTFKADYCTPGSHDFVVTWSVTTGGGVDTYTNPVTITVT